MDANNLENIKRTKGELIMTTMQLSINKIESGVARNGGRYKILQTSDGKFSCWDDKINADIEQYLGTVVETEVTDKYGYRTINSLKALSSDTKIQPTPTPATLAAAPLAKKELATCSVNEPVYRLSVKQTAKGFCYWDVSIRGDAPIESEERLKAAITIAENVCRSRNAETSSSPPNED